MITPYQKPEGKDEKATSFWSNLAGKLGMSAPLIQSASAPAEKAPLLSDGIQTHSANERMIPKNIITTPEFWDCECEKNYIHPKSQPTCKICKTRHDEQPDSRVNEVIEDLGITPKVQEDQGPAGPGAEHLGGIQRVSDQNKVSDELVNRYASVFHRAVAELGQSDRVKAADRLSRIEADMAAFKDKAATLSSGDAAMADLVGEISSKADAISGSCSQLRDKMDGLNMAQVTAIENAFLMLSDAKVSMEAMQAAPALEADLGMDAPAASGEALELPAEESPMPHMPGAEARRSPALTKKAADAAYDDLRMVHTKLSLVDSMLAGLVSESNVGEMLAPEPVPGLPPEGMPQTDQVEGEQKDLEPSVKTAASGDPGDSEPGNTVYKDINKCRDCVWFESDWTHETYRDKCKHCIHASMGGAVDHFWPKSQQMVVWSPAWSAPVAKEKKAFDGSLSLRQTAGKVSAAAVQIAADIVANAAHTAVDLGTELMGYFTDPVIAHSMPLIAHEIAAEIESLTGIEIAITASRAREWGRKGFASGPGRAPKKEKWAPGDEPEYGMEEAQDSAFDKGNEKDAYSNTPEWARENMEPRASAMGEVVIACDAGMVQLAKGEKRKIKELREQLSGETDPGKIKSLNDAIDSLYSRIDADKDRKEKSRAQREEKRKKAEEATAVATAAARAALPAKLAAASAGMIPKYQDQVGQTTESIREKMYGKVNFTGSLTLRQAAIGEEEKDPGLYNQWDSSSTTDNIVADYVQRLEEGLDDSGPDDAPWYVTKAGLEDEWFQGGGKGSGFLTVCQRDNIDVAEKLRDAADEDSDTQQIMWEQMCEDLTELMHEINPGKTAYPGNKQMVGGDKWEARVENFGWQHQDGSKEFKAKTGEELLRAILPNTDCSFKIYKRDGMIEINNAHHDAPTGGEMYYIKPAQDRCELCGDNYLKDTASGGQACPSCESSEFEKKPGEIAPEPGSEAHHDSPSLEDEGKNPGSYEAGSKAKTFRVVASQDKANAFGLHGMILLAKDGEAWKVGHVAAGLPKKGETIVVANWAEKGFEMPEKLPTPPLHIVNEVWGAHSSGRSL